ncbi:ATP-binding protein [Cohnella lubricantis]|uniref:histidine kinase n=1 Tax=Cohnella lubricantis TaxID=2163172 RepID=A0A841TB88_9BACL|nr:ATP-binding protein [Cohnella lubricantis]MBB6678564.1 hypothetical protein [Cohnella lubricantis]MBP2119127.1 two-component system sporulation sensor kinase B [Cohnella lubricantis]
MLTYFKDFLLNILIILLSLILYPYIYKLRERRHYRRFLFYFFFAAAIVLTMSFPIEIHGTIHDLRAVPLAIGTLYSGPIVSLGLFVTVIGCRAVTGLPNFWTYAVSILPAFIIGLFLHAPFRRFSFMSRVGVTILYSAMIKFLTLSLYFLQTDSIATMFASPKAMLNTYTLQALVAAGCVYMLEFLKRHHRLQDEVVRTEKMQIVSDIAASVAHEIRNPLTTVRGFIQLFGTADLSLQKKADYMKLCLEELDRAEQIIADYLSLAKPDPDPDRIETIELNEEILYLSNVLLTYANYNNIRIEVELPRDGRLCAKGDRYKLRQALINIGKNAIEAMPGGGTLELRAEKRLGVSAVTIRDTGVGMTEEQIRRLGSPYYSTKEKGTGLGTMVSFSIIKKMNGRIEVTSNPGRGTEFSLMFPNS